jgi:hypothetical protein
MSELSRVLPLVTIAAVWLYAASGYWKIYRVYRLLGDRTGNLGFFWFSFQFQHPTFSRGMKSYVDYYGTLPDDLKAQVDANSSIDRISDVAGSSLQARELAREVAVGTPERASKGRTDRLGNSVPVARWIHPRVPPGMLRANSLFLPEYSLFFKIFSLLTRVGNCARRSCSTATSGSNKAS